MKLRLWAWIPAWLFAVLFVGMWTAAANQYTGKTVLPGIYQVPAKTLPIIQNLGPRGSRVVKVGNPSELHYQTMSISAFDAHDITSLPTRIEVSGVIVYRAKEADGDVHLWLCDSAKFPKGELKPGQEVRSHCFVAEIMPDLPVEHSDSLVVGVRAVLDGITRFDGEHKWVEIHPVERVSAPRGGP